MTDDEKARILTQLRRLRDLPLQEDCQYADIKTAQVSIGHAVQIYALELAFPDVAPLGPSAPHPSLQARRDDDENDDYWEGDEVTVVAETEKAILCESDSSAYDDEKFWVPRSQLRGGCEDWERGDSGPLLVSKWWARKQGWE